MKSREAKGEPPRLRGGLTAIADAGGPAWSLSDAIFPSKPGGVVVGASSILIQCFSESLKLHARAPAGLRRRGTQSPAPGL